MHIYTYSLKEKVLCKLAELAYNVIYDDTFICYSIYSMLKLNPQNAIKPLLSDIKNNKTEINHPVIF